MKHWALVKNIQWAGSAEAKNLPESVLIIAEDDFVLPSADYAYFENEVVEIIIESEGRGVDCYIKHHSKVTHGEGSPPKKVSNAAQATIFV